MLSSEVSGPMCAPVWQMVVGVSWYQIVVRGEGVERTLLMALSLCIAAVPLALPLLFTATQVLTPGMCGFSWDTNLGHLIDRRRSWFLVEHLMSR